MFNFKPNNRTIVNRNTWGQMRRGDCVAAAFFIAGLKKQYGEDFSIGLTNYDQCGDFIDIIGNGVFRATSQGESLLFDSYVNVWPLAYYANKIIGAWPSLPVAEEKQNTIVLAPIFDCGYNLDRKWEIKFAQQLAQELLKTGKEVVVVGGGDFFLHVKFPDCRMVLNDIQETHKAIRECGVFVGGDSGTSHYCGALESDCKIVSLYGEESQKRVSKSDAYIGKYVTLPPPDFGYAPLVRPSHEWLYKEFPNVDLHEIVEFCK